MCALPRWVECWHLPASYAMIEIEIRLRHAWEARLRVGGLDEEGEKRPTTERDASKAQWNGKKEWKAKRKGTRTREQQATVSRKMAEESEEGRVVMGKGSGVGGERGGEDEGRTVAKWLQRLAEVDAGVAVTLYFGRFNVGASPCRVRAGDSPRI